MQDEVIVESVQCWVNQFIIDLNLCPFAKREVVKNRVRYIVTKAVTEEQLLVALEAELKFLLESSSVETTLLIHPDMLHDFHDYNQFLDLAEGLLHEMELEGIFQIASFHPNYQFGGTEPEDAENYTNRSPYPILHILREDSLEKAIADYMDVANIPVNNIALMNELGCDKLSAILKDCLTGNKPNK